MTSPLPTKIILTADPSFASMAQDEVRRAAPILDFLELAPGIFLTQIDGEFLDLAEAWRVTPPIFVRHICPVQVEFYLGGVAEDVLGLADTVADEIVPLVEADWPFSVQTRILDDQPYKPFDVNNTLAQVIIDRTGAPLDVRQPQQILSVVCTAEMAYLGVSLTAHNLSDWAGGTRRFAREKEQISRAEFKLLEALEVFDIDLPARGVALDLGASPGGWSRILRQKGQYVTAIDPALLDPRLSEDQAVRHLRVTAESYLADEPDTFDLIVNDMRMDARDSARLMVDYAKQIYPGGAAIMTLKLPEEGRATVIEHAWELLETAYTIVGARQLFHNRSEITLYMLPKPRKSEWTE